MEIEFFLPQGPHPTEMEGLEEIRGTVAARHSVNDPDSRRRLLRIHRLAQEWTSALGMRGRSLEELVARSRNLICGTCVGIGRQGIQVDKNVFDLVIIDEAARCTPGELAVGMQSGRRVLLVGDHMQLPPLYGHELIEAIGERLGISSRKELKRSDFERAFHSGYGAEVARSLKRQYRMAPKIGRLVAKSFYPGQDLKTERGEPLVGVICMYAPQVALIDEMLVTSDLPADFRRLVKVGTVDSYQGKENRIVIVSLVRSNPEHHMGFVRTANRINVALSRAMERLVIIGSAKMFEKRGNALSAVVRELRSAQRIVGDGRGVR